MKIAFNLYHREGPWCIRLLPADVDLRDETLGMFDNSLANATLVYDLNAHDLADMLSRGTKVKFVVVMCSNRCYEFAKIFRSRAEAESWIKATAEKLIKNSGCGEPYVGDGTNGPEGALVGKLVQFSDNDDEGYEVCFPDDYFTGRILLETELELSDILVAAGIRNPSLKYELYNCNHGETGPRFNWYPFDGGPEIIPVYAHAEILKVITDTLEGKAGPHKLICYVSGEDCEANAHALVDALKTKLPEFSVAIGQGKGEWAVGIERGTLDEGIAF